MLSREQSVLRFLGKLVPVRRFSWNVLENLFKSHQETFLFQVLLTNPIEFLIISNQKTLKILICQNETGSIELMETDVFIFGSTLEFSHLHLHFHFHLTGF